MGSSSSRPQPVNHTPFNVAQPPPNPYAPGQQARLPQHVLAACGSIRSPMRLTLCATPLLQGAPFAPPGYNGMTNGQFYSGFNAPPGPPMPRPYAPPAVSPALLDLHGQLAMRACMHACMHSCARATCSATPSPAMLSHKMQSPCQPHHHRHTCLHEPHPHRACCPGLSIPRPAAHWRLGLKEHCWVPPPPPAHVTCTGPAAPPAQVPRPLPAAAAPCGHP